MRIHLRCISYFVVCKLINYAKQNEPDTRLAETFASVTTRIPSIASVRNALLCGAGRVGRRVLGLGVAITLEHYMEKTKPEAFIEAEQQLIELMGFQNPVLGSQTRKFHAKNAGGKMQEFPQWGRDNGAALLLIPEFGLCPKSDDTQATVTYETPGHGAGKATERVEKHADRMAALRMALLQAAVAKQKLLGQRSAT
jgi:hypothetical protein